MADDLGVRVAGQLLEGLGAVDDGVVGGGGVAEDERDRGVDGPDVDFGVRAGADADLGGGVGALGGGLR